MKTYSENTLLFNDLSGAGVIHVHARRNFTTEQLAALGMIPGVTRYTASGKSFMTSLSANMSGPFIYGSYLNSISKGRLFTFDELAPQIALAFADAMGVEVEDLDIITQKIGNDDCNTGWIKVAARKLRPKAVAPRNPNAPEFAMTKDDITHGVPIIVASRLFQWSSATLHEDTLYDKVADCTDYRYQASKYPGSGCYIAAYGITEWRVMGRGWSQSFAIVNNAANRKALLAWSLSHNENKLAQELVEKYPDLVSTKVVVKDGHLTVEVEPV